MPHVLTLVEQFWHRVPGGTAKATEKTLNALAAENELTVTGLAARHRAADSQRRRIPDSCSIVHHWLPRPLLYEMWMRSSGFSVDRYLSETDCVVWASSLIVPPTTQPVVATVNDLDFLTYPEFLTRRGRSFFPRMWQRALERSDRFVTPSLVVANDCVRRGVEESRISVVPYGVDAPVCPSGEVDTVLQDVDLPERFVLLVAPLGLRKNPVRLARALAAADCQVVAVGGLDSSVEAVEAFAKLGDRLRSLGLVDEMVLSALYRRAAALVYPSVAEGFGLPVLEAMAHGTPVITSAGTATEEVAGGAALLVDPLDTNSIAEATMAVLSDSHLAGDLAAKGARRATEMTWRHTGDGYTRIFKEAMGLQGGAQ